MMDMYVITLCTGKNTTAHFFRMTVGTAAVMFTPFKCSHYESHTYAKLCKLSMRAGATTLKSVFKCQCTGEASVTQTC